ncbi:Shieldin complex subunit 2 [Varanus komodoensis]|nr:Shieldin complex subunit 2 [Varanus komodoensis]
MDTLKAERQRIEAFELWCWTRFLRVPWTARRSKQSVLEEINPECSLEDQILQMKLKYFGHLMRRKDSLEKSLMLGMIDGKRRRGQQRMRPALMNVEDEGYEISIRVVSELMKKMFLNIPAAWLNKAVEPSLDTTYGMIVADLCRSLLTGTRASYLLTIRSHFILDENSYPLEKEFSLLGFHLNL